MKIVNSIHYVTLGTDQADWWADICERLNIFTRVRKLNEIKKEVMTVCPDADRVAAWELFVEEFTCTVNNHR